MRSPLQKYEIENLGAFMTLDDKDFNDLCSLELNMLHIPGVLYVNKRYQYTGDEILLSDDELKTIIIATTCDLTN